MQGLSDAQQDKCTFSVGEGSKVGLDLKEEKRGREGRPMLVLGQQCPAELSSRMPQIPGGSARLPQKIVTCLECPKKIPGRPECPDAIHTAPETPRVVLECPGSVSNAPK